MARIEDKVNPELDSEINPELDYFMNESESDITFIIDGQTIPALKSLLVVKSRVFKAMFENGFTESIDNEITIIDTNFHSFKSMLRFVYSEQLVIENTETDRLSALMDVFKCGHKYRLFRLMKRVEKEIIKEFYIENIETLYKFALDYDLKNIIKDLKTYIETNFQILRYKGTDWLNRLNTNTDNSWLEVVNKKFLESIREYNRAKEFFTPLTEGSKEFFINGAIYEYKKDKAKRSMREFNFK